MAGEKTALQGLRVLLVEDDVFLMMGLQDMVTGFGCIVAGTAMTVRKAVVLAGELPLDLAILDINLQGELVTPVAEALAGRGVPFIFASGYDAELASALADRPRVAKPYRTQQIFDALSQVMATT